MAHFKTSTYFELTDLNIKDIKSAKSTTDKLYRTRLVRFINESKKYRDDYKKQRIDVDVLEINEFKGKYYYGPYSLTTKEELVSYINNAINQYDKAIKEAEDQLSSQMPDDEWLLWFAFDEQAIKVFGKEAKDLYGLLSDGKNHDIKGELELFPSSVRIINWRII